MKLTTLFLIKLYQLFLSPILATLGSFGGCKFHPTCSRYLCEAVQKHGAAKGLLLGIKRAGRCGPWGEGGYDPIEQ